MTVWVLSGSKGEYEEYSCWIVGVYAIEQTAKIKQNELTADVNFMLNVLKDRPEAVAEVRRSIKGLDPKASEDWLAPCHYTVEEFEVKV